MAREERPRAPGTEWYQACCSHLGAVLFNPSAGRPQPLRHRSARPASGVRLTSATPGPRRARRLLVRAAARRARERSRAPQHRRPPSIAKRRCWAHTSPMFSSCTPKLAISIPGYTDVTGHTEYIIKTTVGETDQQTFSVQHRFSNFIEVRCAASRASIPALLAEAPPASCHSASVA